MQVEVLMDRFLQNPNQIHLLSIYMVWILNPTTFFLLGSSSKWVYKQLRHETKFKTGCVEMLHLQGFEKAPNFTHLRDVQFFTPSTWQMIKHISEVLKRTIHKHVCHPISTSNQSFFTLY